MNGDEGLNALPGFGGILTQIVRRMVHSLLPVCLNALPGFGGILTSALPACTRLPNGSS